MRRLPTRSRTIASAGLRSWVLLVASLIAGVAGAFEAPPALSSLPTSARVETVVERDQAQLGVRLLVHDTGSTRVAGVLFDLAPGWHLYWRNPGGTGLAPDLRFQADGHAVGPIAWPAPETFREADGLFTTFGYEERVLLAVPLEAERAPAEGDVVRLDAKVLVCRTQCVPASFSLSTPLPPGLDPADRRHIAALFEQAAARLPATPAQLGFETAARWREAPPGPDETGVIELRVHACRASAAPCRPVATDPDRALFIPMEDVPFEIEEARIEPPRPNDPAFTIAMSATRLETGDDRLRGLIEVRTPDGGRRSVEVDVPIGDGAGDGMAGGPTLATHPTGGAPAAPVVAAEAPGVAHWLRILLLALLGGVILNGMPCVLPVLAIKVVAIADMAHREAHEVRLHGLAYTGGILASMGLLAGLVVGLRAAGHAVGWGFQFQEPLFVAGISALVVAFALNLFGVYEIELGQGRLASVGQDATGLRRSVFEGLLAVVLATPCTAPFLGTAVGFAFASPAVGIAAIFLAIGLGLALPFLLVSFFPRLARFVPRSGPWMLKLRGALGFSLLATVVWLLWVLGRSGGTAAVIGMTANLLLLAFLLWVYGQLQTSGRAWLSRAGGVAILAVAAAGLNWIDLDRAVASDAIVHDEASGWQPYSEEAVAAALATGRPAFVDFTADWCITCQVNERTVLARPRVLEAFQRADVALFVADWTRRDEGIRRKLAEFGRAGVPLYLVYAPEDPSRPRVLSELLSQAEVIAAIEAPRATATARASAEPR